jgi:hypothetical protein
MPRIETLYHRRLKRPIDEPTRTAINDEYARRRHQIPVATEFQWHPEKPQFTIRSQWLSLIVNLTHPDLVVDVELSLTAKILATEENRQKAVRFIESITSDLGL